MGCGNSICGTVKEAHVYSHPGEQYHPVRSLAHGEAQPWRPAQVKVSRLGAWARPHPSQSTFVSSAKPPTQASRCLSSPGPRSWRIHVQQGSWREWQHALAAHLSGGLSSALLLFSSASNSIHPHPRGLQSSRKPSTPLPFMTASPMDTRRPPSTLCAGVSMSRRPGAHRRAPQAVIPSRRHRTRRGWNIPVLLRSPRLTRLYSLE